MRAECLEGLVQCFVRPSPRKQQLWAKTNFAQPESRELTLFHCDAPLDFIPRSLLAARFVSTSSLPPQPIMPYHHSLPFPLSSGIFSRLLPYYHILYTDSHSFPFHPTTSTLLFLFNEPLHPLSKSNIF